MSDPLKTQRAVLATPSVSGAPLGASVYDEASGTFKPAPQGNQEGPATLGEQGSTFAAWSVERGFAVLDGPSGAGGHPYNAPGVDCVAFTTTGPLEVKVIDNKTLTAGVVRDVSALTTHLVANLDALVAHANDSRFDGLDRITDLRALLKDTADAARAGKPLPEAVELVVTNFGGRSRDISPRLKALGIKFVDLMDGIGVPAVPTAPPIELPPSPLQGGMELLGFQLHGLLREAWAREVLGAAEAEYARLKPQIERQRAAGLWVVLTAVLEMPRSFDVLGWAMGLAEAGQKPKFVLLTMQTGRTREEAEHPQSPSATIGPAPPGPPARELLPPQEGRVWRDFPYQVLPPYPPL